MMEHDLVGHWSTRTWAIGSGIVPGKNFFCKTKTIKNIVLRKPNCLKSRFDQGRFFVKNCKKQQRQGDESSSTRGSQVCTLKSNKSSCQYCEWFFEILQSFVGKWDNKLKFPKTSPKNLWWNLLWFNYSELEQSQIEKTSFSGRNLTT